MVRRLDLAVVAPGDDALVVVERGGRLGSGRKRERSRPIVPPAQSRREHRVAIRPEDHAVERADRHDRGRSDADVDRSAPLPGTHGLGRRLHHPAGRPDDDRIPGSVDGELRVGGGGAARPRQVRGCAPDPRARRPDGGVHAGRVDPDRERVATPVESDRVGPDRRARLGEVDRFLPRTGGGSPERGLEDAVDADVVRPQHDRVATQVERDLRRRADARPRDLHRRLPAGVRGAPRPGLDDVDAGGIRGLVGARAPDLAVPDDDGAARSRRRQIGRDDRVGGGEQDRRAPAHGGRLSGERRAEGGGDDGCGEEAAQHAYVTRIRATARVARP